MKPMLFTNALIFDGTGRDVFAGEVLVEDDRIAAVAEGADQLVRDNTEVIDCEGATLMPGLVEAHAHLSWPSSVGRIFNGPNIAKVLPPEEHLLVTAHNARVTLEAGFTSAYSAGSLGTRFEVALKKEIEGGYLPGPRLVSSSLEQGPAGVPGVPPAEGNKHGRGAAGMRAYVTEMAELGVNSIKLLLSGDDAFAEGASQHLTYSEAEVAAAADEAHARGIWLSCHAQSAESIKLALRHGFRILYHCSHADAEALDLLEAKKAEVFVAPAVGLRYARMHEAEAFGITRAVAEKMGVFAEVERMQKLIPAMRRRGIRVLPGGDYGFPYNPIGRNARDLELFVKLFGFTETEVLIAATKLGGTLMGLPVGVIQDGWLADLLLVQGNPTQDVTSLQDPQRLLRIMKDGRFIKRPTTSEL
ncbi:MAG: amidohydrolase family protein [Acidobacteria bacterium]|nr:amidohydrolase family protein [Acidobacteriota bacterium]